MPEARKLSAPITIQELRDALDKSKLPGDATVEVFWFTSENDSIRLYIDGVHGYDNSEECCIILRAKLRRIECNSGETKLKELLPQ